MPKGIPLTDEELARRRREIAATAVPVFLERGFLEATVREIAAAAGVGKSTLYDYFSSKEEILLFTLVEGIDDLTRQAREIFGDPIPAPEKIRRLMEVHLAYMYKNRKLYLQLSLEVPRLSQETQARIQAARHAYQDLLRDAVAQGIEEGSLRDINPTMASKVLLGIMTPIIYTTRPTGAPTEMMEQALDILFAGMVTRD